MKMSIQPFLIYPFLILGLIEANAQVSQEGFFSLKENLIVWTKIYEVAPDIEEMKKNPFLEFTSDNQGVIKKSKPISLTQRMLEEIIGNFRIDQKEGKYKVEVTKIRTIPSYTIELYGVSSTDKDAPLEEIGLNKKLEFSNYFLNHMAKPYNNLFSSFFDPKTKNDDW